MCGHKKAIRLWVDMHTAAAADKDHPGAAVQLWTKKKTSEKSLSIIKREIKPLGIVNKERSGLCNLILCVHIQEESSGCAVYTQVLWILKCLLKTTVVSLTLCIPSKNMSFGWPGGKEACWRCNPQNKCKQEPQLYAAQKSLSKWRRRAALTTAA